MTTILSRYVEDVKANMKLNCSDEREFINELTTHIEDRLEELRESGLSEEEAANRCVAMLGSAKQLAHQIYEAHSQSTWRQTLLACTPHILFGVLFALNWWQSIGWLLMLLLLTVSTVIYGWCRGKPAWLFPWLGNSLLPAVAAGLLLISIPKGWSWVAVLVYCPLALWLLCSVSVQTIKRDWLYSSLMLLPVPITIAWLLAVQLDSSFPEYSIGRIYDYAPSIGLSFMALALTVAVFMRLRKRWLKVTILLTSGVLTLITVAYYADGRLSLGALTFLILLLFGLFVTPALLQRTLKN